MRSSQLATGVRTGRRSAMLATLAAGLIAAACAPYRTIDIDSTNQSSRVDYLVLHFTSENFADSLRLLSTPSDNPVSAHYLIPANDDETYGRPRPVIHRLVPEHRRAWHAGRSYWAGEESLNDRSIGIELVNESRCSEEEPDAATLPPLAVACEFLPFDDEQIELLIVLARDILERYPGIDPVDVVGHADIAPDRKVDPGPLFPWEALHDAGIGAWHDDTTVARYRSAFRAEPPDMNTVRRGLRLYGYRVDPCGDDSLELQRVLRAFQMHYLPDAVTLAADIETAATLFALLEKYRAEGLAELQAPAACDDDG